MPAERSPKYAVAEASPPHGIVFAPNVTPVTYDDPSSSPYDDGQSPSESLLFPSVDFSKSRSTHTKKKPEDHIPRPPNAFILFRSSFIKGHHVSADVETNHSTLSQIIGLTWHNLPPEERAVWQAKARESLAEHKRRFPKYAFRPTHPKKGGTTSGSEKRRVREKEPKDLKRCAKIAELLVEGKKGAELDAEMQEFDRHHVPEYVTRFEAPVTACTYSRSSSAPVPETDLKRESEAFIQPAPRRARALSSRPKRRSTRTASIAPSEEPDVRLFSNAHETQPEISLDTCFKSEPAFDFNPLSLSETTGPSPTLSSHPYASIPDEYDCYPDLSTPYEQSYEHCSRYQDTFSGSSPLSVDTSYPSDWVSDCSSSPFPATPTSALNDSLFSLDAYDLSSSAVQAPNPDSYYPSPEYPASGDLSFGDPYMHSIEFPAYFPSEFGSSSCFPSEQAFPALAPLDMGLSAYMSSAPQYAM